ncbi:hypothetical protein [Agrobacterium pusense]|jgi:hypothetical protein|nr:hypothetical protein [Agrobacterium tumefaciens]
MAFAMAHIGIFLSLTVGAMLGALAIVTFGLIVAMQRAYRPAPISG